MWSYDFFTLFISHQFAAIVKHDPSPEKEGMFDGVVRYRPGFRQARRNLSVLIQFDQTFGDDTQNLIGRIPSLPVRIQALYIGNHAEH